MEKVEMHVPNKSYNGYYGGVQFIKGVGIFTDVVSAKELAGRYGYKIVEVGTKVNTKVDTEVDAEIDTDVEDKVAITVTPKPKRTRKAKVGE